MPSPRAARQAAPIAEPVIATIEGRGGCVGGRQRRARRQRPAKTCHAHQDRPGGTGAIRSLPHACHHAGAHTSLDALSHPLNAALRAVRKADIPENTGCRLRGRAHRQVFRAQRAHGVRPTAWRSVSRGAAAGRAWDITLHACLLRSQRQGTGMGPWQDCWKHVLSSRNPSGFFYSAPVL